MYYNHVIANILSAFRKEYGEYTLEELENSPECKEYGASIIDCPVCGEKTLNFCNICACCGWEDDMLCDLFDVSLANGTSLHEYKKAYDALSLAKSKLERGALKKAYVATAYTERIDYDDDKLECYTYGIFDSLDDALCAINDNASQIFEEFYDFIDITPIDKSFNTLCDEAINLSYNSEISSYQIDNV